MTEGKKQKMLEEISRIFPGPRKGYPDLALGDLFGIGCFLHHKGYAEAGRKAMYTALLAQDVSDAKNKAILKFALEFPKEAQRASMCHCEFLKLLGNLYLAR